MAATPWLKFLAGLLLTAVLLVVAAVILVPRLVTEDSLREQLRSRTERALNRKVSYDKLSFSWRFAPCVTFRGVTVMERTGDAPFLKAETLTFSLALLPLLHKEVHLREIVLERPVVVFSRDRGGHFNIDDLLKGKSSQYEIQVKRVRIRNGQIWFTDRLQDPDGFTVMLENLELEASGLAKGKKNTFLLSTKIPDPRGPGEVAITGTARIPAREGSLHQSRFDLSLAARNLDLGRYWSYYGSYLPFKPLRGRLDLDGTFKGTPDEFATKTKLRCRDLRFDYPRVFPAALTPRELRLATEVELSRNDLAIKSVDLRVDGLRITGSCLLGDIHSKDPRISAHAVTSPFRLEEFHRYIPFGIIPRITSDFIERHIRGGLYRLDEGRLDGRISQILHMEKGDNHKVLLIRGRVEQGLVDFGPGVPTFNAIKGNLDMLGKDFILRGMTGNFGSSPFTLEGRIADYLHPPGQYPFKMAITPAKDEVDWILRQGRSAGTAFSGRSLLRLAGSGTPADYRVDGEWELSAADYRYRDLIRKPTGTSNRLRFAAHLRDGEVRVDQFHFELPPLQVTADGTFRYHDREPLTFRLSTNRFLVDPLLPLVPGLQKYHPAGGVQARVNGSGNPARPEGLRLAGEINLSDFSARPLQQIKAFSDVTGTIHLDGAALETKTMTGRVGGSRFTVNGRVQGLSDPSADLVFTSPELHLQDLGFHADGAVPEVNDLSAVISINNGKLSIRRLSGQVADSSFAISGEATGGDRPQLSLQANFPYLKVEDLEPLIRLRRAGGDEAGTVGIALKARVTSPAGSFREVSFKDLDAGVAFEGKRLAVESFRAGAFGGTVSGKGEADFADALATCRALYRLDHIDAGQVLTAAGVHPHLTGTLSAEGGLTARGNTPDELVKTARAIAKVHLAGGELTPVPSSKREKESPIPYSALTASLSWGDGTLTVRDLTAAVFSGTVSGNGRVALAASGGPQFQAQYLLHHVDSAQLSRAVGADGYLSGTLDAKGELEGRGHGWEEVRGSGRLVAELDLVNGFIRVAEGETGRIAFKTLHSQLSVDKKVVGVKSLSMEAMGGVVGGHGEVDFGIADGPVYQVNCTVEKVDAAQFFNIFRVTKELSGRLTLQAALTARGDTLDALEKTLQGAVHMRLDKGVINKYRILARVFSILNVSQLLKLQLPDMEMNGLAYNRIEVTFAVREGIASTENFTIDSPTVSMTAVGSTDLVKEEVDLKIGVHPLQTVSSIISRIPVIGWILTGDNRRFLVVYFQAKGPWSDPKVSTLEMSALPRSVFNIFKRVFRLPDTLVTEPGKVIMGH